MSPDAPLRWMLVRREFGVPVTEGGSGQFSADHLFLDQHGVPTIVEVKRSTNTQIRRVVVGQMLDYAANGVRYWPPESLKAVHEAACVEAGQVPDEVIAALVGPEGDADAFWSRVADNLSTGKIRMVFVADEIPSELRRIVEFLNEQLQRAEVFAVEVRQYVGAARRTLVPRVIGATAAARQAKVGTSGVSGPGYDALLADADESVRVVAANLGKWATERGLSTRTTQAGKQFVHPTIGSVAQLYPGWSSVEIWSPGTRRSVVSRMPSARMIAR